MMFQFFPYLYHPHPALIYWVVGAHGMIPTKGLTGWLLGMLLCLPGVVAATGFGRSRDSLTALLRHEESVREGNVLCQLGSLHYRNFELDEALQYAGKALRTGTKTRDEKLIIRAHRLFADIYYAQARYDLSLKHFFIELDYHTKNRDVLKVAEVQCNIGVVYDVQGFLEKGLYYYLEAMKGYEQTDDKEGLVATLCNLAHIYRGQGNHREAIRYFTRAARLEEQYLKAQKPHYYMVSMAEAHLSLQEFPEAMALVNRADATIKQLVKPDDEDLLLLLDNFRIKGKILQKEGDFKNAEEAFREALQLSRKSGYKEKEAPVLISIGELKLGQGALAEAEKLLLEALAIGTETKSYSVQRSAWKLLSEVYARENNFPKAHACLKKYLEIHDTLINIEGARRMSEMRALYDADKQEATIKLLEKDNEISRLATSRRENQLMVMVLFAVLLLMAAGLYYNRYRLKKRSELLLAEKNRELAILNATKDKFFAILGHDLRNPVFSFKSISTQLKNNLKNLSSEELQYFLEELDKGATSIHQLLINLLEWAKSQRGQVHPEPEEIDLDEMIRQVTGLFESPVRHRNLRINADIPEGLVLVTDRNILFTVLRNVVGNAVKFSPEGGELHIGVFRNAHHVDVAIRDEGIGMSREDLEKLFRIDVNARSIGSSDQKGSGLGLILSKELLDRIGGSIHVQSTEGNGSTFTIRIPNEVESRK